MKALIISAAICAAAAGASATASESWIAASPAYDARSGGEDQSFAAGALETSNWRDSGAWRFGGDDGDKWLGHGERGGDEGDEWHDHPIGVAPEAATWQLLLLGAAAVGLVRLRTARRS